MQKFLSRLILGMSLVMPIAIQAQDHDDHHSNKRYYDKAHKDYHEWNSDEEANYRKWQKETHRKDHEFDHANKREQQEYWNSRHEHSDHN